MTPQPVTPAAPLPTWFRTLRNTFLGLYAAVAVGCIVGSLGIGAVGMVAYRDFNSYTLAGNPWDPTHFPWYVIWPMRLMSIVGAQIVAALAFAILFVVVAIFWPVRIGSPMVKRIGIGTLALALELATAAWFGRWFG